jgi:hypothetical protein
VWYDWSVVKPPSYRSSPSNGASRIQRLSLVQRNYLCAMAWIVPMFAIDLLVSSVLVVLICIAGWLIAIPAWISLSARIHRQHRGGGH